MATGEASAELPLGPRVDLRLLVVKEGTADDPVEAFVARLDAEGVPYTTVNLADSDRAVIDDSFLADTVAGYPRAKFQAIVMSDPSPVGLGDAELDAVHRYQSTYGVRGLFAQAEPSAAVGLREPWDGGYSGPVDGRTATVTAEGLDGPFRYLDGTVKFPDDEPAVDETWAALADVRPTTAGSSFEPLVTMDIPGTSKPAPLVGVLRSGGREDMVVTFSMDKTHLPTLALGHGVLNWLTKGVHLGYDRSAFDVHVDDVLLPNYLWSTTYDCTPGSGNCGSNEEAALAEVAVARMSAEDVEVLREWQQEYGFALDMVYNAYGVEAEMQRTGGTDELADALIQNKDEFKWINHTYAHTYFGCERDFSVVPWRCQTSLTGDIRWTPTRLIVSDIKRNIAWAQDAGIPIDPSELVAGEHGGLWRPQEGSDNPNLVKALDRLGIATIASDDSSEPHSRPVGSATAVPRYPVDIYYDTVTREQAVDQYNWSYTTRAEGGSGRCEADDAIPCLDPLTSPEQYETVVIREQVDNALRSVLANDPRTFYVHQSNLINAEPHGALLYPYLEQVLDTYRETFADNRPLLQRTFTEGRDEMLRQDAWREAVASGQISGYIVGGSVVIENLGSDVLTAPLTTPQGTTTPSGEAWGSDYAAERSDWISIARDSAAVRTLASAPYQVG